MSALEEEKAQEPSPAERDDEARSADHIVQAVVRAAKGLVIYPPGSSFHSRFLSELHARLTDHLETWGPLELEIEHYEIRSCSRVVYENRNPKDSLAFRIHADGIASLVFREGLAPDEIRAFLEILNSRRSEEEDDDMVTLLWSAELEHIAYELEDDLEQGDEPPLAAAQAAGEREAALRRVSQEAEPAAAETPLRRDRALDILTLTEDEEAFLAKAIAFDESKNPLDDLLEILPAMLTAGEEEGFQREILDLIGAISARLLADGLVDHALALLGILREKAGDRELSPELAGAAAAALAGVGSAPEMESPEGFLRAAGSFGPAKIVKLIDLLGPDAVRPFCLLLADDLDEGTEQGILEALAPPAKEKPEVFLPFLSADNPPLSKKILAVLRTAGSDAAGPMLAGLAAGRDPSLLREIMTGLQTFDVPGGEEILFGMLEDENSSVRINAVRTLGGGSWPSAFARVLSLLATPAFRERGMAEKKVFYETLTRLDETRALPVLREALAARYPFARKKEREEVLCAAAGLQKMASPEALEALRGGRDSRKGELREALATAVRRLERPGMKKDDQP